MWPVTRWSDKRFSRTAPDRGSRLLRLALERLGDRERVGGLQKRVAQEVVDAGPAAAAELGFGRPNVVIGA